MAKEDLIEFQGVYAISCQTLYVKRSVLVDEVLKVLTTIFGEQVSSRPIDAVCDILGPR